MSKSIGKVFGSLTGTKGISYDSTPANNYMSYLKNYDTSKTDETLANLQNYALQQSGNLSNMQWNMPSISENDWYMPTVNAENWNFPTVNKEDWKFSIDASDDARKRAENATYQSYMDYLTPQFERQTNDLESSLINKGLAVGSDAYQRAMSDLQDRQNAAVNQAAYQSVLNGQNAYSQSINDQIAAGNFGNTAQQAYQNALLNANTAQTDFNNAQMAANEARTGYINAQNAVNNAQTTYLAQILGALGEAPSAYDIQGDIYAVGSNKAQNEYTAKQQTAANRLALINSLVQGGSALAGSMAKASAGGA